MEDCVKKAFDTPEPACVVAQHGQRVIGASLLDARPDAPNHLLSGPMILHEYRNRSVGSALLAASLRFLRSRGLHSAKGVTRPGSTVARFVYPKFGGVQSPFAGDPFESPRG
jgi:GNAT superfamily N-acetyltransferase